MPIGALVLTVTRKWWSNAHFLFIQSSCSAHDVQLAPALSILKRLSRLAQRAPGADRLDQMGMSRHVFRHLL